MEQKEGREWVNLVLGQSIEALQRGDGESNIIQICFTLFMNCPIWVVYKLNLVALCAKIDFDFLII